MFKFLSVTMNFLAAGCGLLLMAASAWLITYASFRPPLSALAVGIIVVRTAGLFRAVFRYADRYLTHTAIFKTLTKIRLKFYNLAVCKFPLKSGVSGESEFLHDLTVSADLIKDLFPRVIQPILCTVIITAVADVFLFGTIGSISLILIFSMMLNFVIPYIVGKRQKADDIEYRKILLDFNEGREEIISAGSGQAAIEKLEERADLLSRIEFINSDKTANVETLCNIVNICAMIIIVNELTSCVDIIDLAVWLFILLSIIEMFNSLPKAVETFCEIKSMENGFVETKNKSDESICVEKSLSVKIDNLNFGYNESVKVLENLSLTVNRGGKIAIIGESGSGKTTLLYILSELWKPDSGEIFINGTISAATTNNYIFSSSIRENFKFFHPNIIQDKMNEVLKICQIEYLDIDREIGENGSKLSGGERCRLQTALALASDSDILILDEPTAGLDKTTAENLIREILINANKRDRTLIIITHDLAVAEKMCVIYKLKSGKLIKPE